MTAVLLLGLGCSAAPAADFNNDGLGDVWGLVYNATGLTAGADADGDGLPNWKESTAGTDPWSPTSFHAVTRGSIGGQAASLDWFARRGKRYDLLLRTNLAAGGWTTNLTWYGADTNVSAAFAPPEGARYYSVEVRDLDTDADGLFDWEELALGLSPATNRSNRTSTTDSNKVRNAITRYTNWVSVIPLASSAEEGWPDPGVFAILRTGRVDRITIPFTIAGTAGAGTDYTLSTNGSITLEPGVREAWVQVTALADGAPEGDESVILTLGTSTLYRLGAPAAATVTIVNAAAGMPSAGEASRFLHQGTFGATTQDLASVRLSGLVTWLTNQYALPPTFLSSYMAVVTNVYTNTYGQHKLLAWWERAMHAPDQLRHRMAFALSQIMVVSDYNDTLNNDWGCMISYYDELLNHAFGNYRDLLRAVSLHPAMGIYLSHFGNQKADPELGRYPDENYAREVMQLFSIGLWELNPDGTQKMTNGAPIPTYSNADITELARVFTGLSWGTGNTNLWWEFFWPEVYDLRPPMRMWGEYHDTNTKVLVRGTVLPAGQPPMEDIDDAIDNLFNHPNVGPFLGRRLIQRFTTSNPSTGYLARVTAAFNNNGAGVRGDLKAVLTAILMDPEARDAGQLQQISNGKQREPYLRLLNLARAFDAAATNGFYECWWLDESFGMQPFSSPSVFNFYLPDYRPNGPVKDAGLVAPEFQITTAVTGISSPNQFLTSTYYGLNRWPAGDDSDVELRLDPWIARAAHLPTLLEQLDLLLTYGNLRPQQHQIIREALERIPANEPEQRVRMAIYLITTSPEFCVLK